MHIKFMHNLIEMKLPTSFIVISLTIVAIYLQRSIRILNTSFP